MKEALHPEPDLLIVEDDPSLAEVLAEALEETAAGVRVASSGAEALRLARETKPTLVLLDLGLPDLDGMSVCSELIAMRGPQVIVVTAQDDPDLVEAALDMGADDYVRKPFNLNELRARIRTALRKREPENRGVVKVGHLEIDLNQCRVRVDGREPELSATELKLLRFFAEHPGWVFSKERLLEALWPGDRDAHAVQVHISNLRRKIEADPSNPKLLVTVKGLGYKLAL